MPDLQIENLDQLQKKMQQMLRNGGKHSRKAVTMAVTPIAKAYRTAAPNPNRKREASRKRGRPMKRAVFKKTLKGNRKRESLAKAGFNVAKKRRDDRRAYHAHLPLLGTKNRQTKSGQFRGRVTFARGSALRHRIRASVSAGLVQARRIVNTELSRSVRDEWES